MILIVGIQELKGLMMGLDLRINKTTQATDEKNEIVKYREEHPHCRYCIYEKFSDYTSFYCTVHRKAYFLNRAKYCNLYKVDTKLE